MRVRRVIGAGSRRKFPGRLSELLTRERIRRQTCRGPDFGLHRERPEIDPGFAMAALPAQRVRHCQALFSVKK